MFSSHVTTKLGQLLDGRLSPRKSAKLRAHLDRCDSCRAEWEQQSALWAKLGESKPIQPSTAFTERVLRNLDTPVRVGAGAFAEPRRLFTAHAAEDADARGGLSAIWRWVGAPAAAVAVGVALSATVYILREPQPRAPRDSTPAGSSSARPLDNLETQLRALLQADDAEQILETLRSLPEDQREEYLYRVWEARGLDKDALRRSRRD
jgi:anti-sigma factor RsiW